MSERLALRMRADYFENIINKDIGFFDERRTGDLLSRLNTDIDVI
jgi:ATP-binding cassette subfamily B (MDR/TAP) protein 10